MFHFFLNVCLFFFFVSGFRPYSKLNEFSRFLFSLLFFLFFLSIKAKKHLTKTVEPLNLEQSFQVCATNHQLEIDNFILNNFLLHPKSVVFWLKWYFKQVNSNKDSFFFSMSAIQKTVIHVIEIAATKRICGLIHHTVRATQSTRYRCVLVLARWISSCLLNSIKFVHRKDTWWHKNWAYQLNQNEISIEVGAQTWNVCQIKNKFRAHGTISLRNID